MSDYEEKIARLAAARAAVEAAKTACEATEINTSSPLSGGDMLDALAWRIDAAVASAERQRVPIAIGDMVMVFSGHRDQWDNVRLTTAKDKWITAGGMQYSRNGGVAKSIGRPCVIHPDDLARINRDIPARKGGAR